MKGDTQAGSGYPKRSRGSQSTKLSAQQGTHSPPVVLAQEALGTEELEQEALGTEELEQEDLGTEELEQEDLGTEELEQEDLGTEELEQEDLEEELEDLEGQVEEEEDLETLCSTNEREKGLAIKARNLGKKVRVRSSCVVIFQMT